MSKKLYVGNCPFSLTDASLEAIFSKCGKVESAKIIIDRESGRSKGFGFVEMATAEEAQRAITEINQTEHGGRELKVSEARPQVPRENNRFSSGRAGSRSRY